jgi:hypothetical protein
MISARSWWLRVPRFSMRYNVGFFFIFDGYWMGLSTDRGGRCQVSSYASGVEGAVKGRYDCFYAGS